MVLLLLLVSFAVRCSALTSPSPSILEVDTLVIGGGVSGLTSAFYSSEGGAKTLLAESAPSKLGGVIDTKQRDGYQWEDGPNTFQASAKDMLRLAADLNLEIVASDPKLPKFVLSDDGELYALPKDLPKLLSFGGLLTAAAGLLLRPVAPSPTDDDESIASFVSRVFGEEVLQKVVEPFVSTVYTGDPSAMSLASVFPFLGDLARAADGTPGGLLHCFVVSKKNAAAKAANASKNIDWSRVDAGESLRPYARDYGALPEVPKGASLSFAKGLSALPSAVQAALGEDVCRLGWKAISVRPVEDEDDDGNIDKQDRFDVRFETPDGDKIVRAFTVIVSTPAAVSASLLSSLAPSASNLASIQAPPVVAVTVAYPKSALAPSRAVDEERIGGGLHGFGLLIPRTAKLETLGFQFISSLFPSRAPDGEQVLLSYYGGAQCQVNADHMDGLSDDDIVAKVHADAKKLLLSPDAPNPKVLSVRRWKEGIPQYGIGHAGLVDAVRRELPRTNRGGVQLGGAGSGGGISLGDCARGGYECARVALAMSRYRAALSAAREYQHGSLN